jgi:hypothetical protein
MIVSCYIKYTIFLLNSTIFEIVFKRRHMTFYCHLAPHNGMILDVPESTPILTQYNIGESCVSTGGWEDSYLSSVKKINKATSPRFSRTGGARNKTLRLPERRRIGAEFIVVGSSRVSAKLMQTNAPESTKALP